MTRRPPFRRRPPWWPADEPFPPVRGVRPHFPRRFFLWIALVFALLFALACGLTSVVYWLVGTALGVVGAPRNMAFITPVVVIVFALLFMALLRTVRTVSSVVFPLGELMSAAGRVAEGDYSARIKERGPHEMRGLARAFNTMAARLQETDEQRRRLLADVTHELRTPLTVIQGNLEGLLDHVYPRDDAHLTPILEETRILARLIEDLRTLALAESGALQLQKEPTDLGVLVSETVASFRGQAEGKGIELAAEVAPDLPVTLLDPARIRQVLENLIANALRFTPHGGTVRVQASAEPKDSKVSVTVTDTGSGITPDDLPHIFDRFYKSADSRGTGLGLTIAKNLIAAHGGEISAQTELGHGTTIHFGLPASGETPSG